MDELDQGAWQLYCNVTKDSVSKVDFWEQLGPNQQKYWRDRVLDIRKKQLLGFPGYE